jgi:putative transposase
MSYTNLLYHIVFSTKDRRPFLADDLRPRVRDYIGGIVHAEGGQLLAADGAPDHFHLAVNLSATRAVADVVRVVKTNSSKWLHEQMPDMQAFSWQDSYSAFTVSPSVLGQVVHYIGNQAEHHKTVSFEDELRRLLDKHGIAYDPKYL